MSLFKVYRGNKQALPTTMHDGYAYFCADSGEFFIDVDLSSDGTGLQRVQINALAASQLTDGVTTIDVDDIVLTTDPVVKYNSADGATLTLNAVLVGNGTDTVKLIPASLGAFFVDSTTDGPKFGVLPVAQGGIGVNTLAEGGILKGNGTGSIQTVSGTGVLYAATEGAPQFGVAPLAAGGTGGTDAATARTNLDVYSKTEVDTQIANAEVDAYTKTEMDTKLGAIYSKTEVDEKLADATTVAYTTTLATSGWQTNADGGYVLTYSNSSLKCGAAHDVPPQITYTSNREEYNKIESATAESGVGIKFYIDEVPANDIGIIIIDHL